METYASNLIYNLLFIKRFEFPLKNYEQERYHYYPYLHLFFLYFFALTKPLCLVLLAPPQARHKGWTGQARWFKLNAIYQ